MDFKAHKKSLYRSYGSITIYCFMC